MSIKESYAQGTPSWVDLATTDIDGAKEFYGELLGWEFVTAPIGPMSDRYASAQA